LKEGIHGINERFATADHERAGRQTVDHFRAEALGADQRPEDADELKRREASDFLLPTNHEGECFDFHSLRHTCGAWLALAGEHPKVVQTIMRLSQITLPNSSSCDISRVFRFLKQLKRSGSHAQVPTNNGLTPALGCVVKSKARTRNPQNLDFSGRSTGKVALLIGVRHEQPIPTSQRHFR
jgi:sarcosine oxidase delta subunit